MKSIFIMLLLALCISSGLQAQNDSIPAIDLLSEITSVDAVDQPLLPNKYPFTQRLMWGEKGLMRSFTVFKLSPEEREKELKIRRKMLVAHQVIGFATMGGMVAQGIVGARLYNGHSELKGTHEALAGVVNFGYFTTASLALFAPPKMLDERKGYSSIKVHKALSIIHMTSMIAVNVLATQLESHPNLKPYHRAAAYTAFGSFAAAMVVIKF